MTELKNSTQSFNSRRPNRRISELEDRSTENSSMRNKKNKVRKGMKKVGGTYMTPLRETMQASLESQEKKRGRKEQKAYVKEIMAENLPNWVRDLDIQVHEAHRLP